MLGVCLAADDSVTSLVDVISTKDQARLFKTLDAAQPYEDVRTAYLIVGALQSLGFTEASKKVSVPFYSQGNIFKINSIIYNLPRYGIVPAYLSRIMPRLT